MLGAVDVFSHLNDHPWQGCQMELFGVTLTFMSSAISSMVLVAMAIIALVLPAARRRTTVPSGGHNVLEVLVVFIRDRVARPALHEKAYDYLPLLLTLFLFVFGLNLIGFFHLDLIFLALAGVVPWFHHHPIGLTPTAIMTVCAGLASVALLATMLGGLRRTIRDFRRKRRWPLMLVAMLSPVLWVLSLSPPIPGKVGLAMLVPMSLLELAGAVAKAFSLTVRLFANMLAGHAIMATLLLFVAAGSQAMIREGAQYVWYVGPACVLGSVLISLMELMMAGLQAFIFTFITALMLGLYAESHH